MSGDIAVETSVPFDFGFTSGEKNNNNSLAGE